MNKKYDVVVIGAGPAGYVAAIRCAQLGMKTACVDAWRDGEGKPSLGGTCLNAGCIPSKALLESSELFEKVHHGIAGHGIAAEGVSVDVPAMMAHKDKVVSDLTTGIAGLFRSNDIDWIAGRGQLLPERKVQVTPHEGRRSTLEAGHVILAAGSRPTELEAVPLDGERIVDSTGALNWVSVPKRLGIIGAGVIGLELGSVWRRLGAEVTLLEAQPEFLSIADQQVARTALNLFRKQGLNIRLDAVVTGSVKQNGGVAVSYRDPDGEQVLEVDHLIVAVGRRPCTEGLASADAELELDEGGLVHVDDNCETSLPGVYAIGDVVRGPMLAHKGSEEGVAVAERIAGQSTRVNYAAIPSVIYTDPEIAWVGMTEAAAKQAGIDYNTGSFPFLASGRARAMQHTEGMVKLLTDAASDRLLGVHIIGAQASELIAQAVLALEFDATGEDIARTVFAHPTLSEAFQEAALAADGRPINLARKKR